MGKVLTFDNGKQHAKAWKEKGERYGKPCYFWWIIAWDTDYPTYIRAAEMNRKNAKKTAKRLIGLMD